MVSTSFHISHPSSLSVHVMFSEDLKNATFHIGSEITACIKIDKALVVYRFSVHVTF